MKGEVVSWSCKWLIKTLWKATRKKTQYWDLGSRKLENDFSYTWVNIQLGRASSYSNRCGKHLFRLLFRTSFKISVSGIIVSFCFWPKLFLPRLIIFIFGHFQKLNFLSRGQTFATTKKCTFGSELILERKFQTLMEDNFIVEISRVFWTNDSEVNNTDSDAISGIC